MIIITLQDSDDLIGDQGEGLYCFKTKVKRNDILYNGVEFVTRVADARDAKNELYGLFYKEESCDLHFFKPSMDIGYRADKALFDDRILEVRNGGDPANQFIVDGRDAARVLFEKTIATDPTLLKRKFEVFLPESFKVSQRPFGLPPGKPGTFTMASSKTYMYRAPFQPAIDGRAAIQETYHTFLSWRFVDMATEQELTLGGNTAAVALAAGFAGL